MRGGGGTSVTEQGRFKDANVDGLSYTGSLPGITTDGGRFNYQTGDRLTFSVGDIELGTAVGSSIITLNSLEGKNAVQVSKIAQLLQNLDSEGTVADGITINAPAQEALKEGADGVAAVITQLATDVVDFGGLTALVAAVNTADTTTNTYTVVTKTAADAHLATTQICVNSGGFVSTTADKIGFLVNVTTNAATTRKVSDSAIGGSSTTEDFVANKPVRIGGSIDATHRFTGAYQSTRTGASVTAASSVDGDTVTGAESIYGIFTFDITGTNTVTGVAYNVDNNISYDLTGTLAATAQGAIARVLSATASDGTKIRATLNLVTGSITTATWYFIDADNPDDNVRGIFVGSGCKLN